MACAPPEFKSYEISPEEGGRDSTDVNLGDMVDELLLLLDELKESDNTKKEIENKIRIKLQEHKCWSEDDIKQAWKERFVCDICKENAAQKNRDNTTDEQDYGSASEDTSSQSSDEETAGDAGEKKRKFRQTGSAKHGRTGKPLKFKTNFCESDPSNLNDQSGMDGREASDTETEVKRRKDKTIYIRIPLSEIIDNKANPTEKGKKIDSQYKLIDSPPKKSDQVPDKETKIKTNGFYVMLFNEKKNQAEWVYEILNKKTVPLYKPQSFKEDRNDKGYKFPYERNPQYERGHLAAAANHTWCQEAYEETYWMSNITPQNKNLNRGAWKQLEIYCRDKILSENVHNVHVYTGPLYLKKSDEENLCMPQRSETKDLTAQPTHYFKVLIVENKDGTVNEAECFYIPNAERQKFKLVKIEEIERLSGLMFKEESSGLKEVKKEMTWKGNQGETSITIDVSISSYEKNEE